MLHEILLALSGYPGGIIVDDGKTFKVLPNLDFLHSGEADLINRVCRLGYYYYQFQSFATKYLSTSKKRKDDPNELRSGVYLSAFCVGLDNVLEPYRQAILVIEQEVLRDSHLPISYLQHQLEEYQMTFPVLAETLSYLSSGKYYGCRIFDLLYQQQNCGIKSVEDCLQIIINTCYKAMCKQLSTWLLHGFIVDRYEEFFICQARPLDQDESDSNLDHSTASGQELIEIESVRIMKEFKYLRYTLRSEVLPAHIPPRIADKIVFIGESVRIFENARELSLLNNGELNSIYGDKMNEIIVRLKSLSSQQVFSLSVFEEVIDEIRSTVAESLWRIVVDDANLVDHLKILKEFFLLGRGELFLAFIDQCNDFLKKPPSTIIEHDLNLAFQQAAHKIILPDEDFLSQFHLKIIQPEVEQKNIPIEQQESDREEAECGWTCLNLQYNVQWPLQLILTKPILEKYNVLFRFLISVNRIQLELQHCWKLQMQKRQEWQEQTQFRNIWNLRNHMAFLVDNLQYYLQVDVLEGQFTILMDKIKSTKDFEHVRIAHDQFISALVGQSFRLLKPVSHCLDEILNLCQRFCAFVNRQSDEVLESSAEEFDEISKCFERQTSLLLKILSSVRSHQASPHLSQLLLRIDFNKFFSSSTGLS
ncbi:uncharacterized protein TRIADDRAFT_23331 [Trichoplax adhaerens]|uniref:Gamma-tubulin complex component n=1 Tax=Trichoplax adhaerens TaxID=10228 RepID=B3RSJ9_TRIAD|nr:hypothetical protein TRIADDRAFT_23331 [Trichoplax adhaerens]EDV27073.1 hypothetical protein TRIADDRAFT_23331 [Trichoplax adhaerens]|eukprot:XP_002111069.1 hypothetical protein TRIADDRAFT_23331 [Trichoplax adhaerens]